MTIAVGSTGFALRSFPVIVVSAVVAGAAVPWLVVGMVTARQRYSPARLQGRVAAVTVLAMNGPQSVSIALGAALVGLVDHRVLVAVTAAVILGSGLWLLRRPARAPEPVAVA